MPPTSPKSVLDPIPGPSWYVQKSIRTNNGYTIFFCRIISLNKTAKLFQPQTEFPIIAQSCFTGPWPSYTVVVNKKRDLQLLKANAKTCGKISSPKFQLKMSMKSDELQSQKNGALKVHLFVYLILQSHLINSVKGFMNCKL